MSMSIEVARRILEASKQRAMELRSPVSIAIVDAGGHLVLFERMMSPYGWATGNISIAKANTAVMFNQSTDAVAQWGSGIPGFASSMATMTNGRFIMAAGGWPIRMGGATIGGIGVSGGNAPGRDDEIARAGLAAVEAMIPTVPPVPPVQPVQPVPAMQPSNFAPQPSLHAAMQPTPVYPSMPVSPPQPQQQAPGMPAPQNIPTSTHNAGPDQDRPYNDEYMPFDDANETHGGQQ